MSLKDVTCEQHVSGEAASVHHLCLQGMCSGTLLSVGNNSVCLLCGDWQVVCSRFIKAFLVETSDQLLLEQGGYVRVNQNNNEDVVVISKQWAEGFL